MASDPAATPQPVTVTDVPLGGSRSQSVQRLQIGLSGLAAMLLLVGLATAIMNRAQESEDQAVPEAAPSIVANEAAEPASDPLADAGVVPDLSSPEPSSSGGAAPRNGAKPNSRP